MNQPQHPQLQQQPPAETQRALDAVEGEVLAEREFPDGTVQVAVGDKVVHILPSDEWTSGAYQDLSEGRFEDWAQDCLAGDDYEEVWTELNDGRGPRLREIQDMFETWGELTGQSQGKSRGSNRYSRRMRRR